MSNISQKKINVELNNIVDSVSKISQDDLKIFEKLVDEIKRKIRKNKILFCGNGGSAAQAQHLACELVVRYKKNRKSIPAISITTDTSNLTAIGNDFNFDEVFARQIEAIGNKGDICIFLTTSGNSKNLINAAKVANKKKLSSYCFSGKNGGKLKRFVKNNIVVRSNITSTVQSVHLMLGHLFCQEIEEHILRK